MTVFNISDRFLHVDGIQPIRVYVQAAIVSHWNSESYFVHKPCRLRRSLEIYSSYMHQDFANEKKNVFIFFQQNFLEHVR